MKTVVVLGDGMSDRPLACLGHRTPLQVAHTPHMDAIARQGRMGQLQTLPPGVSLGSEMANLSVLGYDPRLLPSGRGALEALGMRVPLGAQEVAFRCNLVHVSAGRLVAPAVGDISREAGIRLMACLNAQLARDFRFYSGMGHRHLLVLGGGFSDQVQCVAPHECVGQWVADLLPYATEVAFEKTAVLLREIMEASQRLLEVHPINQARQQQHMPVANALWPWSPGRLPVLMPFVERFGKRGAVVSAVDVIKGLAVALGLEVRAVSGATGDWDTHYEGKAKACLEALETCDFVYVHVEAIDEASHRRDVKRKIRCIEDMDARLVGPLLEGLRSRGMEVAIAVLPDHPTLVEQGVHANDAVPFALWRPGELPDGTDGFDESQAVLGVWGLLSGATFMEQALKT